MLRKVLVLLVFVVLSMMAVMALTKPDSNAHRHEVSRLALNMVHAELAHSQHSEEYVMKATTEAMNRVNTYLQDRLTVNDYVIVSVGMLDYHGNTYPITIGAFKKVYVLIGEDKIKKIFLKWEQ